MRNTRPVDLSKTRTRDYEGKGRANCDGKDIIDRLNYAIRLGTFLVSIPTDSCRPRSMADLHSSLFVRGHVATEEMKTS